MLKMYWGRKAWGRKVQKVYIIPAPKEKFLGPERLGPEKLGFDYIPKTFRLPGDRIDFSFYICTK